MRILNMNMKFELEREIKSHAPNLQSKEMPSSPPTPLFDSLYLFFLYSFMYTYNYFIYMEKEHSQIIISHFIRIFWSHGFILTFLRNYF